MKDIALFDKAVDALSHDGYFIWDHFVDSDSVSMLRNCIFEHYEEGNFKKAGIGKQVLFQVDKGIRGDYIKWIDKKNSHPAVKSYLEQIESFMQYLNQTCFLGLKDFESHFAHYPEGTFYKKHVDRFQQNAHRVISFVLYLNENWQPADAGELKIYLEDKEETVAPLGGRLALFRSEMEHEVLLSNASRYSITGWMLDKDMSLTFLP